MWLELALPRAAWRNVDTYFSDIHPEAHCDERLFHGPMSALERGQSGESLHTIDAVTACDIKDLGSP